MSVASLSCDVDWEIKKGQRGVRDGPNEFEGRVEVSGTKLMKATCSAQLQEAATNRSSR